MKRIRMNVIYSIREHPHCSHSTSGSIIICHTRHKCPLKAYTVCFEYACNNMTTSNSVTTVASLYNKYLIDLLLHAKAADGGGGSVRRALSVAGHKAIDPDSPVYIRCAAKSVAGGEDGSKVCRALASDAGETSVLANEIAQAFELLPGVHLRSISAAYSSDDDQDSCDARTYVYVLAVLAKTYGEVAGVGEDDDPAAENPLVNSVILTLTRQLGEDEGGSVDAQTVVDGIMDDDIAMLLKRVGAAHSQAQRRSERGGEQAGEPSASLPPLDDLLKSLKSSKIMDMASEIHKEIDLSGTEDPMELLSFDKLTDSNSVLGSIVSKVGSKIQSKLASGELKHDELIGEAMGFLKAFEGAAGGGGEGGANPLAGILSALGGAAGGGGGGTGNLMADVMRMAQGLGGGAAAAAARGGGNGRSSLSERRERLREKVLSKNKA